MREVLFLGELSPLQSYAVGMLIQDQHRLIRIKCNLCVCVNCVCFNLELQRN